MRALALALCLIPFGGCDSSFPGEAPSDYTLLAATEWDLVELPDRSVDVGTLLVFDSASALSGRASCNTYSGTYSAGSGGIVGPVFGASVETVTEMACPGDTGAYESEYFDALERAVRWSGDGERLTLTLPDGRGKMEFVRSE